VTDLTFEREVLQAEQPVLVDFWAAWCGPCRLIAPVVEELAREYQGVLKVGKVDVDESDGLAMQYQIMSIPTLALFHGGHLVARIVGYMPKAELKRRIDQVLAGFPRPAAAAAD
jgi:thioredoxin 1